MVEFLLTKLRSWVPDLVDTVRRRFTTETLTAALRSRLEKGESIRNLQGALEEILAESV
jgi:hypothetical protein